MTFSKYAFYTYKYTYYSLSFSSHHFPTGPTGVKISGTRINNLAFADDIDLIEEDAQSLEETTRALNEEGKRYGLNMNFEKQRQWYLEKRNQQENC